MNAPQRWAVVDASVLVAFVKAEVLSEQADRLLESLQAANIKMAAPLLLRYELTSIVRKNVYRKLIKASDATTIQMELAKQIRRITFFIDDDLLQRAYDLATQLNLPTAYDSQYLAVAERWGCDFWTADERLYNSVKQELTWVRWVGQLA